MGTQDTGTLLTARKCKPCGQGQPPLPETTIAELLKAIPGWEYANGEITRTFRFKNHYEAVSFVNAVAWISHREDHHPDIRLGYNTCCVNYSTHSIGGLSENDFICAAKVNALL